MKNFIKNYLLLSLMGLGFVIVIGLMVIVDANAPKPGETQATAVAADGAVVASDAVMPPMEMTELGILSIEKMDGGIVQFNVEVAKTMEEWSNGLMYRTSLPENQGMLFVFQDNQERAFWMKNVVIPLDMVFIDNEGIIHNIISNAVPGDESQRRSNGPVPYVLEINGGVAEKLGIEVGDKVIHAEIRPIQ